MCPFADRRWTLTGDHSPWYRRGTRLSAGKPADGSGVIVGLRDALLRVAADRFRVIRPRRGYGRPELALQDAP